MGSTDDTAITWGSLLVDGRVDLDGTVAIHDLLGLATGIDEGRPSIALVDVLAPIRLSAQADVLVISGDHRRSVALPVRAIVRQPNIRLIVDSTPPAPVEVVLDAPDWTDSDEPLIVRRVTALTFAEFVMQQ